MPLNFPLESKSESMQTTPFSVVSAKRNKSWDCTHLLAHQIKFYVTKQIILIHIHNTNTYITSNFDILSRISFLSFFFRNQSFQGIHPKNCTNIAKRIFASLFTFFKRKHKQTTTLLRVKTINVPLPPSDKKLDFYILKFVHKMAQ
jgi:hypothetical protein